MVRSAHIKIFQHKYEKEAHRTIVGEFEVAHSSLERKRVFSL